MRRPSRLRLTGVLSKGFPELAWPAIVICALFAGVILAAETSQQTYAKAILAVETAISWRPSKQKPPQPVLVVTANPDRQMQVVATLSPRGFQAHLAGNIDQVKRQLTGMEPLLAIVDGAVHDADAISRLLRSRLPASRIVVLSRSTPREAIGQILLDRL